MEPEIEWNMEIETCDRVEHGKWSLQGIFLKGLRFFENRHIANEERGRWFHVVCGIFLIFLRFHSKLVILFLRIDAKML